MSEIIGSILTETESNQTSTRKVGEFGEQVAIDYLNRKGFRLVVANYKAPIGRNRKGVQVTGEIDIIAFDEDRLCFIEVKTRSSDNYASPLSAIDLRKQRQIIRTAKVYRKNFNLNNIKFRYDAISVVLNGKKAPTIKLVKGFWNESKFKKKAWSGDYF